MRYGDLQTPILANDKRELLKVYEIFADITKFRKKYPKRDSKLPSTYV